MDYWYVKFVCGCNWFSTIQRCFWSTSIQPGANYTPYPQEVFLDREITVATFSTGPISAGDRIYYANYDNIMMCSRADGLIYKSDRRFTMINRLIADWALFNSLSQGELYSSSTTINSLTDN